MMELTQQQEEIVPNGNLYLSNGFSTQQHVQQWQQATPSAVVLSKEQHERTTPLFSFCSHMDLYNNNNKIE